MLKVDEFCSNTWELVMPNIWKDDDMFYGYLEAKISIWVRDYVTYYEKSSMYKKLRNDKWFFIKRVKVKNL